VWDIEFSFDFFQNHNSLQKKIWGRKFPFLEKIKKENKLSHAFSFL